MADLEVLARTAYSAFNARDIDAALATMHPDVEMGKRLWEYNAMATITSGLPVQTMVIYLKKDRKVDDAPYRLELPTGEVSHTFSYQRIKLWELTAEVFQQPGLEGLLPLLPLTKDGMRREVVDEVIEGLIRSNKTELLSLSYLLASLVFEKPGEREWLDRRKPAAPDTVKTMTSRAGP